jgi:hypothetical protein
MNAPPPEALTPAAQSLFDVYRARCEARASLVCLQRLSPLSSRSRWRY